MSGKVARPSFNKFRMSGKGGCWWGLRGIGSTVGIPAYAGMTVGRGRPAPVAVGHCAIPFQSVLHYPGPGKAARSARPLFIARPRPPPPLIGGGIRG